MARIRTIKPDYYRSLDTAEWSLLAFALGPGLLCICDDEGRAIADPRLLASELGPIRDDVTPESVDVCLEEWASAGFLTLYEVDGRPYLQVNKWDDHQRINRPTESKLPAPSDADKSGSRKAHAPLTENTVSAPTLLTEGREGKGREGNRDTTMTADAVEGPTFDEWWDAYRDVARGRPTGYGNRKPAEKAWSKLSRDDRVKAVEAVEAYGRLLGLEDADRDRPYPSQHGSTWLNSRTFDDVGQQLVDRRGAVVKQSGRPRPPPMEPAGPVADWMGDTA